MKDKEIQLRLMETLAAGELNRGHYHAMASAFEGGLKTLLHDLEVNPPLAEVEGWVYVADTCIYIGADGMIMVRREMLPDVKEGDQLTVTIRGKP